MATPPIRAGILVGGQSRRMGTAKALLEVGSLTLLERTLEVLRSVADRPFAEIAFLGRAPAFTAARGTVGRIDDRAGLSGPLAGLLGAFDEAPRSTWLVVACDLPRLEASAIEWLLAERDPTRLAVLPRLSARSRSIEPLLALYEPGARPLLERLAAEPSGPARSLQRLRGLSGVASPVVPTALRTAWTNVNTPEEWREVSTAPATLATATTPPTRSTSPRRRARRAPAHPRR